eukprot:g3145.t1
MPVFSVKILVSKTDGIAPSLILTCSARDGASQEVQYIFNLPPSLIRLAASHGVHFSHTAAFFISRNDIDSMGGFCSAFLRKYFCGKKSPKFIAPNGFERIIEGYSRLNGRFRTADVLCIHSNAPECVFIDNYIDVCALHDGSSSAPVPLWLTDGVIDLLSEDESTSSKMSICQEVIEISSDSSEESDPEVLIDLLPKKRKRQKPKEDHSKRVKSMIKGKVCETFIESDLELNSSCLPCFLVHLKSTDEILVVLKLTCKENIQSLIQHPLWGYIRYPQKKIKAIFHLSSPELIQTALYRKWMLSLDANHIVVDPTFGQREGLDIGLIKVLDRSLRLRVITQNHFPLPFSLTNQENEQIIPRRGIESGRFIMEVGLLTEVVQLDSKSDLKILKSPLQQVVPDVFTSDLLRSNSHLRKIVQLIKEQNLNSMDPWENYRTVFNTNGTVKGFATRTSSSWLYPVDPTLRLAPSLTIERFAPQCIVKMAMNKDPSYMLFLGTGCAEPSSWRGASGILLVISFTQQLMLLDCGEGTFGQIIRYYGCLEAKNMVNRLSCIWISHQHIDHCAGIPEILSTRDHSLPPVTIIGPSSVLKWLKILSKECAMKFMFSSFDMMRHNHKLKQTLQITEWESTPVAHSVPCFGIRIQFSTGFTLVYSGDTEPCERLVKMGCNCTCLIHESTHSICDGHHARKTKHSTWNEALDVGKKMNAFRTILTHFSRRYPCLPQGLTAQVLGDSAAVAFDGMKLRIDFDLPSQPVLLIDDFVVFFKSPIQILREEDLIILSLKLQSNSKVSSSTSTSSSETDDSEDKAENGRRSSSTLSENEGTDSDNSSGSESEAQQEDNSSSTGAAINGGHKSSLPDSPMQFWRKLNGTPFVSDVLIYKILEVKKSWEPVVSPWRYGVVIKVNLNNKKAESVIHLAPWPDRRVHPDPRQTTISSSEEESEKSEIVKYKTERVLEVPRSEYLDNGHLMRKLTDFVDIRQVDAETVRKYQMTTMETGVKKRKHNEKLETTTKELPPAKAARKGLAGVLSYLRGA